MKRDYRLVSCIKGTKHFEKLHYGSSVECWQEKVKKDEADGCVVRVNYEYNEIFREVVMTKYYSFNPKTKISVLITLQK